MSAIDAVPRSVGNASECRFYHTMEVPGHGLVCGEWDLRPNVNAYLGRVNFAGKRVLEVGTANGYLAFEMEKQGAEVVAYDLDEHCVWDVVPLDGHVSKEVAAQQASIRRLNNGFWFTHQRLGSRVRLVHGTAYTIPEAIGPVDIATYCSILLHLRDPFLALQRGATLAREKIIVTDTFGRLYLLRRFLTKLRLLASRVPGLGLAASPALRFVPHPTAHPDLLSWWVISPEAVIAFLQVLGFGDTKLTFHDQLHNGVKIRLFTVVGSRTSQLPPPDTH